MNSFLNTRNAGDNTSLPNTWLNVVVLDEQLNPVLNTGKGHGSYFQQVGANNTFTTHSANRLITKSGYVGTQEKRTKAQAQHGIDITVEYIKAKNRVNLIPLPQKAQATSQKPNGRYLQPEESL